MLVLSYAAPEAPPLLRLIEYAIPIFMGPLMLLTWHPRLVVGADDVPRRSAIGSIVLTLLSAAYFAVSWRHGVTYQGHAHAIALLSLNVIVLVACWGMLCGVSGILCVTAEGVVPVAISASRRPGLHSETVGRRIAGQVASISSNTR